MSKIYEKSAYIFAMPDLHLGYLKRNPANNEALDLTNKYNEAVHKEISSYSNEQSEKKKALDLINKCNETAQKVVSSDNNEKLAKQENEIIKKNT
ncbi:unnamed protein product [Cunninghamella echinulata]